MGSPWPVFKQIIWLNIGLLALAAFMHISGCSLKREPKKSDVWIYTSLPPETVQELTPAIQNALPDLRVNFFQASAEEVIARYNADAINGATKADLLLVSNRFWLEDLAQKDLLQPFTSPALPGVPPEFRNAKGLYAAIALPAVVIAYNSEVLTKNQVPKSFKELGDEKWKDKVSTGDPLASNSNFTILAMLQSRYGWEYVQHWKRNHVIVEGGSAAVLKRLQSKERPIGIVSLHSLMGMKGENNHIQAIFPEDGAIFEPEAVAILKKSDANFVAAQRIVDWMYSPEAQQVMVRASFYSPLPNIAAPLGAPSLQVAKENAFHWTEDFLNNIVEEQIRIKEKFAEIMLD